MIYVSLPYSHPDSDVVTTRYVKSCLYSAYLMVQGHAFQSPITTGHAVAQVKHDLPTDFAFWQNFCLATLAICDEMHVLMLDGWDKSVGVAAEIEFAVQHGIKVKYVDWNTYTLYDAPK